MKAIFKLRGLAPDATGDLPSEEFVRRIREGWIPPWKSAPLPRAVKEAMKILNKNYSPPEKEFHALAVIEAALKVREEGK